MEKFKTVIQRRKNLIIAYCGFILLLLFIMNYYIPHEETFQTGFILGLIISTELIALIHFRKYAAALKDEAALRQLYIMETDERHQFIKAKIGGTGINIILACLAVSTIITGFLNQLIFLSLFFTLLFCALVKGSLKLYYKNKL